MAELATTQSKITLIVVSNALDSKNTQVLHGDSLVELAQSVYPKGLPDNTRIYHEKWDSDRDVTPQTEQDIDTLNALTGVFYCVTYPAAAVPLWAVLAISIGVSLAVAFLMPMPQMPNGGNQPPSPNNALAQRTNRQRLGGRVPDIYGQVWAIPDLIAPTYSAYINHDETEFSFMVVGRGQFNITKAYDDTTPIEQVNGATVEVYNPHHSVYGTPDFKFGSAYNSLEQTLSRLLTKRYTSVNGQVLTPPDAFTKANIVANANGTLSGGDINYTQFTVGQSVTLSNADNLASANSVVDASGNPVTYSLNGTYIVKAATDTILTLDAPETVNSDWQKLKDNADYTVAKELTLGTNSLQMWQGWFYTDNSDFTSLMINVIAPNGIYNMNKEGDAWAPDHVQFEIETQILNSDNSLALGRLDSFTLQSRSADKHTAGNKYTFSTDDDVRRSAAMTAFVNLPERVAGQTVRWRIRRVTPTIKFNGQQVIQEIIVKDFYTCRYLTGFEQSYDATTVYVKQRATEGARSLKERKLKLLVERYVRDWRGEANSFYVSKLSRRIDDIIYDMATDPKIGGLQAGDLNMAQISAEVDSIIDYFGDVRFAEFCGTFDNTDVTIEEMIKAVCDAAFCQAYRINNQIHIHFEKKEPLSVVQFNAHNMLPDTYDYSESFGARNDYDGVQVTYTDPVDDARVTLDYPPDKSAQNPQKIETFGVRNKAQAHALMMRAHWKNQLANKSCKFTGADEGGILIPTNRIDVADIYSANVQQGVVNEQTINTNSQTVLTLSDSVNLAQGQQATIFVQTVAGVVDNIACTIGANANQVVLSRAPVQPLSLSWDAVVRATYKLVTHSDFSRDAYLVTAKSAGSNALSHEITAVNYDDKYYQSDTDFKNGQIN